MTAQNDETTLANNEKQFAEQAAEFNAQVQREKANEIFPHEGIIEEKLRLMSELPGAEIPFTQEEYELIGFEETALTEAEAQAGAVWDA